MPHVQITLLEGRSVEQKRKLVERVTDALVEEAGAAREGVAVSLIEVKADCYARGGVLIADKNKK